MRASGITYDTGFFNAGASTREPFEAGASTLEPFERQGEEMVAAIPPAAVRRAGRRTRAI
jgi:hypothetical protein